MILNGLFNDKGTEILKKVLDFSAQNQKVIAHNIANVETPGFTAKKLEFTEELKNAVKSGNIESIRNLKASISDNYENPYRMDMNNVDVEKELLELEENRMRYDMISTMLKNKLTKWARIFEAVRNY